MFLVKKKHNAKTYIFIYLCSEKLFKSQCFFLKCNGKKSNRIEQTFRSFRIQNMAGP